ncbi:O-antigen polymerase [Bacillus sp. S/N-304-OC-R1]|uniref:O-antigen polymerase n=1 Tax=Bacillus sp. S/N-304-OC-R1 TaxID=2758034 RepID=UPI001C8EC235|nr:O-antigen polymerase [Bacillus sp. S/N-304-OC-R1]MBY0123493.1 oligosaccharide repeat unit polymerase [Bacillus sp. S/N-304-OC-R1]
MLAFIIWVIVLAVSIKLFASVSGSLSLTKPNLGSLIFYYSLLVSSYIGSLLIALDIDHYYMINKLHHDVYRYIGFGAVSFVMVFLPLSMLLVSRLAGFDAKKEFNDYLKKPVENTFSQKNEFYLLFLGLSLISMLAVAYTLLKTNQVPIFSLLKGNFSELGLQRIEAARNFHGNVYIRNIFAIALTPLLSLIAYVYAVKTRHLKWIFLFFALFACAVAISVYDLSKSPIFFYIIMYIFVRLYVGKLVLTWNKIIGYTLSGAVVIVGMYVFIQGVKDLESFFSYSSGPIGRIILAQISPTYLHLDLFGNSIPFLNGRSLPSIVIGWFDLEQVRSARLVMANAFPNRIDDGTGGVLNTLFIAEAYANFGYLGIILGTMYVGVLVQLIYIIFIRLPKNPVFLCLFIYFSINIPRTLVGGFTDFLFNPIWIFITCLFAGILLFIRFRLDLFAYFSRKKAAGNER